MEALPVGTPLYTMNRSQSINHADGNRRNWACWNESGKRGVVSLVSVFFLWHCVPPWSTKPGRGLLIQNSLSGHSWAHWESWNGCCCLLKTTFFFHGGGGFTAESCPELSLLRTQILKGWPNNRKDVAPALSPLFLVRNKLSDHKRLIMRGKHHYIVPVSLHSTPTKHTKNWSEWNKDYVNCTGSQKCIASPICDLKLSAMPAQR